MSKDYFVVFGEWEDNCEELSDEEFGRIMRAFFGYVRRGEKPEFSDRSMRLCWKPIKNACDRADEAYESKCKTNRINGKKGGAPIGNQNAKKQKNNRNNRTVEKTTETTLPNPNPDPNPDLRLSAAFGGADNRNWKYSEDSEGRLWASPEED